MKFFLSTLVSTTLLLLLAEWFSFAFYKPEISDDIYALLERDEKLMWKNRRGFRGGFLGETITINKDGSRRTSPQDIVADEKILVIGGSPSYGLGVDDESNFPATLQANLSEVKVVNWSVPGFSSEQGLRAIDSLLENYQPKLVIISFIVNDIDFTRFYYSQSIEDREVRVLQQPVSWIVGLIERRYSYRLIARVMRLMKGGTNTKESSNSRVSLQNYIENLKMIGERVKNSGADVIFLHIPVYFPVEKIIPKRALLAELNIRSLEYSHGLIKEVGKEYGVLDFSESFKAVGFKDVFLYEKGDHIHPSKRGHGIISNELLKQIRTRRLFKLSDKVF